MPLAALTLVSRFSGWAASAFAAWALASWAGEPAKPGIPRDYLDSFLPLPERFDTPANPATDAKIALGRMLFFDRRLSENGHLACHGCHDLKSRVVRTLAAIPGYARLFEEAFPGARPAVTYDNFLLWDMADGGFWEGW
jgi:cytochrome c peroxidase